MRSGEEVKEDKIKEQTVEKISKKMDKHENNMEGEEVFLRVYDLSGGMAKQFSHQILGIHIEGIWHTSIEAYGNEYYFQNGLKTSRAGETGYGKCVERISLGKTPCTLEVLNEFFEHSKHEWNPSAYHLFEKNCNHFTDYLSWFLLEKGIPKHILELPDKVKDSPFFRRLAGNKYTTQ